MDPKVAQLNDLSAPQPHHPASPLGTVRRAGRGESVRGAACRGNPRPRPRSERTISSGMTISSALSNAFEQHDVPDFGIQRRVQQRRPIRRDGEPVSFHVGPSRKVDQPTDTMRVEIQEPKHRRGDALNEIDAASAECPIAVDRVFRLLSIANGRGRLTESRLDVESESVPPRQPSATSDTRARRRKRVSE